MKFIIHIIAACLILSVSSCLRKSVEKQTVVVSIPPVMGIVDGLLDDELYDVSVLVPAGVSPESYSPTPAQMRKIETASCLIITNTLEFEKELLERLTADDFKGTIIDLSKGVELIRTANEGAGAHNHSGVDPHYWMSPKSLKQIVQNLSANMVVDKNVEKYHERIATLGEAIDSLDWYVSSHISENNIKYLVIYHPSLGYYSRDYDTNQIALENDGKEPSAAYLGQLADSVKKLGLRSILYQKEFPEETVRAAADAIGLQPVEIDPLSEDIIVEIRRITDIVCGK